MDYFKKILVALVDLVDIAVPVGVNNRTKVAVVAAVALPKVSALACSLYPPLCPLAAAVVPAMTGTAAALAPVFAAAGLLRK